MSVGSKATERTVHTTPKAPYALKELDKVAEIASFFGFLPIKTPELSKDDRSKANLFRADNEKVTAAAKAAQAVSHTEIEDHIHSTPEEKIALLRNYLEHNMSMLPHPLMLYYKKPLAGVVEKKKTHFQCGLDIIGTANSVAEALTIKTLYAILSEQGFHDMYVEINTMGDKDSIVRFERELSSFIKKNTADIPTELRAVVKRDPCDLLRSHDARIAELKERAPKPMSYLSEASIQHFKEVLEYLEALNIPYRIDEYMVGDRTYCSQTIFKIRGLAKGQKDGDPMLLAGGARHNYISKKIGFKKDIPIMSATISYKKVSEPVVYKITIKKIAQPKFYFIQLGFRARLKSLHIIDTLRKAHIPVYHSLTKDKLINQLSSAESLRLSHLIIMGQKEALDNTVVIRNMETRAQDTVSCSELSSYLQKLQKAR